jgi:hypothetical protein
MSTERVQRSAFDLDSFSEVLLVKEFEFTPVGSTDEALAKLGNDSKRLLEVINNGLKSEIRNEVAEDPDGWRTFDDEGELNGAFSGTLADMKAVNNLVLTLAKTVFGYSKDLDKDQKRAAKDAAMAMIQNTEAIKAGLKKSAARK